MNFIGALAAGLGAGGLYAVIGVCLVLMATLTRVVNFSQVAVGVYAAFFAIRFVPLGVPPWGIVLIALVIGAAVSALLGWIIATWLPEASTTARSAVTVAGLLFFLSLSYLQFGTRPQALVPLGQRTARQLRGRHDHEAVTRPHPARDRARRRSPSSSSPRPHSEFSCARSPTGRPPPSCSASTSRSSRSASGPSPALSWRSPSASPATARRPTPGSMVNLIIPGAAAALIGAFKRMDLAIIGGILLGGIQGLLTTIPSINLLRDWIPIIIIVIFLLWSQRKEVWDVAR